MIDKRPAKTYIIIGGAGFIGSHFVDHLLADNSISAVTIFDNFSSGREWHFAHHHSKSRLRVIRGDVVDLAALTTAMAGHDTVIHLASNPDIARATTDPEIDFEQGTRLTNNVLEAMRRMDVRRILYASGSGVYGDIGTTEATEDYGPLLPISTYGASKLAGEAMISSYCAMFGMVGRSFRFGNVVGSRQTHGVGFDFIRRLSADPTRLQILGDGSQSKSYIHVDDVITAVLLADSRAGETYTVFNIATGDYVTVTEIAELAVECLGLSPPPRFEYTGGKRGWKGDVPVVRIDTRRITALGWKCRLGSREALRNSMNMLIADVRAKRL